MTTTISDTRESSVGARVQSLRWGLAALVVACALAVFGAYADPHPKTSQEQAVPFICGVLVVLAAGIFGFVVPAGLRGATRAPSGWSRAALVLGIVALVSVPVSFWSGLPLLLGTAGVLIGMAGRRAVTVAGLRQGVARWGVGLSAFSIVACLVVGILGTLAGPN